MKRGLNKEASLHENKTQDTVENIGKILAKVIDLLPRIGKYKGNDDDEFMSLKEMLLSHLISLNKVDLEGDDGAAKRLASRHLFGFIKSLISYMEKERSKHSKLFKNENRHVRLSQVEPKQKRSWFYRVIKTLFDFF